MANPRIADAAPEHRRCEIAALRFLSRSRILALDPAALIATLFYRAKAPARYCIYPRPAATRLVPITLSWSLAGGVLVDVFLLCVMDANERFDRLDDALGVAHEVFVNVLGT